MSMYNTNTNTPGVLGQLVTQNISTGTYSSPTYSSLFNITNNDINAFNIDVSLIMYFRQYNTQGEYKTYVQNTPVLYNDVLYYNNTSTTGQNIPHDKSLIWKRLENVPNLYSKSTTEPYGSKRSGDKWFNPSTNITYSYTKINNVYQWISS